MFTWQTPTLMQIESRSSTLAGMISRSGAVLAAAKTSLHRLPGLRSSFHQIT